MVQVDNEENIELKEKGLTTHSHPLTKGWLLIHALSTNQNENIAGQDNRALEN